MLFKCTALIFSFVADIASIVPMIFLFNSMSFLVWKHSHSERTGLQSRQIPETDT